MSGGSSTGPGSMQGGTAMDAAQRARLNRMFDVARANHRVNFRELGQRAAERQRQAIEQRKRLLQAEEERKERARRRLERKRREAERGAATAESSSDSDDAALGDEEAGGGGSYVDDGEGTYSDEERDLTLMNRGMISRDEYGWRRRKAMSRKRRALARETAEKRDAAARRAREEREAELRRRREEHVHARKGGKYGRRLDMGPREKRDSVLREFAEAMQSEDTFKIGVLLRHEQQYLDLETRDKMGRTALMVAAKCGDVALIKFLVESGVNPDVEDKMGRTALMIAAKRGNASAVKALILDEFGNTRGKVLHRNKHRRTAIDVAVDANRPAIVGILRSAVIQQRNNERGAAGFYRGVGRAAVKAVVTAPIRARKAARRARLAPSLNRDRREEAARIFQAAWRGHCARQQYRDMRRIVRLAQTRELIRRFSAFYRDHVLVVRVQRTFRAYLARKRAREYRRMCHAAILVQTRFRVHRAVQLVYSLRAETCKAVLMQRLWRGHKGRQRAQHARTLRDSATTIQRMWRGVMGRRRRWTWLQELSHAATVELLRRHTADLRWMLVVEGLKQQKVAVWQIENTWRAFCRVTQLKNVMRRRLFSAWRNEYTWDEAARTVQRVYRGFLGRRTAAVRRSVIKDWHREIQGCLVVRRLHAFGGRVSNATKVAKQNVTYLDTERERGREGDPALPGDGTEPMAPWKRRERKPTVPRQHRKPPTATKRLMGILGLENGPGQPGGPQERREGSVPALTASPGQWSRQRTDPMALALTVVPPHSSDEDEDDEGEGAWNAGGASQHSRGAHRSPARKQGRGRGDGQRLALLAPSPLAAHKRPSPETPPSSAGQQPGSAPERRRRRAPATDAFPPSRTPARTPLSTERRRWRSQQQEGTGGGALRSGRLGLRASQSGPNLGMDGPPALPPAVEAARGRKRLEARRLRAELRASEQREEALRARRAREEVEKRRREREASNRAAKHAAMAPLALPSGRGPTPPGSHPARSTRSALDGASESFASYASRGMADARDARVWAAMERATHSPSKRAPFTPGAAPWASKRDAYGTDEEEGYGYGDWAAENEWGRARPSDAATREPRTGWRGDEEEDQWEDSEEEDEEEGSADDRHMPPAPQPEAGEGASPGSPRDGAGGGDVERVGPRMTGSFDRSVVVILRHDQTALDGHGQAHRMWQLRRQKRGGGRATQETARSEAPAEGVEEEQAGSWLGLTYPTLRAQYPALVLVKRASLPADVYAAAPRVVWLTGLDEGHGVLLGRGRSADVQLDSAVYPKLVSSRHAMLRASRTTRLLHAPPGLQPREDDASERHPPSGTGHKHVEWVVGAEDLDSTNGTFLNGARVCREDGSVRLHHGDVITLGANATDTRSRSDVVFVVSLPQGVAQEAQRERQRRKRDADPAPRPVRARRLGTSHRDARSNAAALVPVGAGGDGSSDEKAREKEEDQQSKEQQQQQQPPQQQQSPPAPPAESSALLHVLQQQQQLLGAVVTMGMSRQWGGGMYGAAPQPWGQPQYDGYGYGPDQGYAYGHSASQGYGYDYGQGYGHDASPPAPGSEARPDTHRQRQAGQAPEGGAAGDHAVGAEDSASAGGQEGGEPAPTPQPSSAGEGEGSSPLPARRGCSTHGGSPRGSESPPTQTLALPAPEESEEERAARERREREQEKDRALRLRYVLDDESQRAAFASFLRGEGCRAEMDFWKEVEVVRQASRFAARRTARQAKQQERIRDRVYMRQHRERWSRAAGVEAEDDGEDSVIAELEQEEAEEEEELELHGVPSSLVDAVSDDGFVIGLFLQMWSQYVEPAKAPVRQRTRSALQVAVEGRRDSEKVHPMERRMELQTLLVQCQRDVEAHWVRDAFRRYESSAIGGRLVMEPFRVEAAVHLQRVWRAWRHRQVLKDNRVKVEVVGDTLMDVLANVWECLDSGEQTWDSDRAMGCSVHTADLLTGDEEEEEESMDEDEAVAEIERQRLQQQREAQEAAEAAAARRVAEQQAEQQARRQDVARSSGRSAGRSTRHSARERSGEDSSGDSESDDSRRRRRHRRRHRHHHGERSRKHRRHKKHKHKHKRSHRERSEDGRKARGGSDSDREGAVRTVRGSVGARTERTAGTPAARGTPTPSAPPGSVEPAEDAKSVDEYGFDLG